ncbi:MAG: hypothetical protein GYA60_01575 [Candidatus Methanofastidiosa archaeon]|nr:hypothetical protein [Candidatus Methanofastidiosa archaeon]
MINFRGKRRLIVALAMTGVYALGTFTGIPLEYIQPIITTALPVVIGGITATDLARIIKEYNGIPED